MRAEGTRSGLGLGFGVGVVKAVGAFWAWKGFPVEHRKAHLLAANRAFTSGDCATVMRWLGDKGAELSEESLCVSVTLSVVGAGLGVGEKIEEVRLGWAWTRMVE